MQSLRWYARRVRTMAPAEVVWRARGVLRDLSDRVRIPLHLLPSAAALGNGRSADPAFRLTDLSPGEWGTARDGREALWTARLLPRAEHALTHRFSFFNLEDRDLGDPIQWNFDADRGVPTPVGFSQGIDYRDYSVTGDCKVVWEPSRHHQLVVLGRAYRATGDVRFAREVAAQIDSWIVQCPFGRGMQWRSPLELAIRAINWVWAYDLIRESGAFDPQARARFLHALYLHLWDISRKFSSGSSANNHLIGEAAGVFVASTYFSRMPQAERWREESIAILERQIIEQTYEDGGGREQAFGYHGFVLQFFLAAAIVARRAGVDLSARYGARLERMLEFACRMLEGGPPPMFGDADDGYVLDLGVAPGDMRDLLAVGAVLYQRADFKRAAAGHEEPVGWLLGREGLARYDALATPAAPPTLEPHAFPQSGYYLLQCGHADQSDRISILFDSGELGFGPIAAHGHADALSFTVRAFGEDFLVDPGTYDYFTYPQWRDYFRSTAAHNTMAVDGADQSIMLGGFLWGNRAKARCTSWDPQPSHPAVDGEHDGFTRLADPVTHRRHLALDSSSRVLTISDEIHASGVHEITLYFHLSEHCRAELQSPHTVAISSGRGSAMLRTDPALQVTALRGSGDPPMGWVSRGYHRKTPSTTLVARAHTDGAATFVCRLEVGPSSRV